MNGQLYQICCIVAAAKKALHENASIQFSPMNYVNKIEFCFLPSSRICTRKKHTAETVAQWFLCCQKKELRDIKMICPIGVKAPLLLGFSNTTKSAVLCFYGDGSVTCFSPNWQFDSTKKKWNLFFTEQNCSNPPPEKPRFENNTGSFRKTLDEIEKLADKIECDHFAKIFAHSLSILNGSGDSPDVKYGLALPALPAESLRLFEAASTADVIGAMGSWNDSPPYMAHEKGLDAEYRALSDELLKNIRMSVLYAVNEW